MRLLLPLNMDISIPRYLIKRAKRLPIESDVFVVDEREARGAPVAVPSTRAFRCGGRRVWWGRMCLLSLGGHFWWRG